MIRRTRAIMLGFSEERAARGPLLTFFALTFVATWISWLIAWCLSDRVSAGFPAAGLPLVIFDFGVFAPAFVAVGLTARHEGEAGVRALLHRLVQVRARAGWYAFAIAYMAAIKLAAALIHRVATGAWPRFGSEPFYLMVAATIGSMLVFGQSGEETGWRGYALPRLASRVGLGGASVALGIIWALWHLPLFFIAGTDTAGQSFPLYLLQVTALSVAIAWLYANTNGSLFLTMLMHSAINNTKDIVPSFAQPGTSPFALGYSPIGWITAGLLWVGAGGFLVLMHRASRTRREQNP
jgi:membrane protease YdiL (CAAX protease family)